MPDEPVYRITLVRHGESVGNAEERLQGHADYPLSERGRAQAIALAQRWKAEAVTFDHVIASPLSRALETARIIAAELSVPHPEIDPRWIERDVGKRTGMTYAEAAQRARETHLAGPGESPAASAESDWDLYLRGDLALRSILKRPPARYLVASHRAILNMVLYSMLGIAPQPATIHRSTRFRIANGAFSRLRYYPLADCWQVDVIGDRSHWKGDG
jgi:broad specificity phosphatase PhoE